MFLNKIYLLIKKITKIIMAEKVIKHKRLDIFILTCLHEAGVDYNAILEYRSLYTSRVVFKLNFIQSVYTCVIICYRIDKLHLIKNFYMSNHSKSLRQMFIIMGIATDVSQQNYKPF